MEPLPSRSASNGFALHKEVTELETPRIHPNSTTTLSTVEWFIAGIYPATLVLASTFYLLSPSPATNESYFSQKGNLFNVVFVKYGWLWTTFAFLVHCTRLRKSSKPKAALRWGLATVWWILVTQWFLGPPLMDRAFLVTGGTCEMLDTEGPDAMGMSKGKLLITSAACKLQGGKWRGGHDLSGHVFLLTHASLFLWSELLPFLRAGVSGGMESGAVFTILGMWWWMLLMTGIYFHTWTEKVTGLIVATMQWGLLYGWALKALPGVRVALGIPGV
ncbi:inositol phospholipid synthesis and fat-storage-inducing TM-domain-containing protein [Trichophaea hybrida]|nr:inositol phospholipid synthesis and fat-storage-inducing TM-domain-containing protein [Trichophaea hybrida]